MTGLLKRIIILQFLVLGFAGCQLQTVRERMVRIEDLVKKGELTFAAEEAGILASSGRLTPQERFKIDSLLEICHRIKRDFTLSDTAVLLRLKKFHPTFDSIGLLRLEKEHKLDVWRIDGVKRYFSNSVRNVFLLDSTFARLKAQKEGIGIDSFPIFKKTHTARIVSQSDLSGKPVEPVRLVLSYTIRVKADAVPEGETIRCWMPFPRENHLRQQNVRLISSDPAKATVSPATDLQRSIYLERTAVRNEPTVFHTELEYTSYAQSFQLTPEMIVPYQKNTPLYKENTSERAPQIVFNNRIKTLAKSIIQDETNPLLQVRRIYQWINDSVTWASALEYSIMQDIPGFVMENRHGDCGMQTLLFMSLARSAGIPVKWQSGWMLHPGEVNLHDWCEVWYEGIGWVPLDQSFGIQESTDIKIRNFYTTGIDSYRYIVNDDFSQPFTPVKKYLRSEPYDFQRGEVEWKGGNLYFDKWSWHMDVSYNPGPSL